MEWDSISEASYQRLTEFESKDMLGNQACWSDTASMMPDMSWVSLSPLFGCQGIAQLRGNREWEWQPQHGILRYWAADDTPLATEGFSPNCHCYLLQNHHYYNMFAYARLTPGFDDLLDKTLSSTLLQFYSTHYFSIIGVRNQQQSCTTFNSWPWYKLNSRDQLFRRPRSASIHL